MAVRILRSRTSIAAMAISLPLVAGCSTNFGAPTDQVYNPARGVNDRSGSVYVLNAVVVSQSAGSGAVVATLVDSDAEHDDRLTKVSVAGADGTVDAAASQIPAGGYLNLADNGGIPISAGVVKAGDFVDITFTFERAETVTVHAPVVPKSGDYADVTAG